MPRTASAPDAVARAAAKRKKSSSSSSSDHAIAEAGAARANAASRAATARVDEGLVGVAELLPSRIQFVRARLPDAGYEDLRAKYTAPGGDAKLDGAMASDDDEDFQGHGGGGGRQELFDGRLLDCEWRAVRRVGPGLLKCAHTHGCPTPAVYAVTAPWLSCSLLLIRGHAFSAWATPAS